MISYTVNMVAIIQWCVPYTPWIQDLNTNSNSCVNVITLALSCSPHFTKISWCRSEDEREEMTEDGKTKIRRTFNRPARFYERQDLKQSYAFHRLVTEFVAQRHKASMTVLNGVMWSLCALRITGHSEDTPDCIKVASLFNILKSCSAFV